MKKVLLLVALIVWSGQEGFSQLTKGNLMAGGSLSFNRKQIKESNNPNELDNLIETKLGLQPLFGYFIADKWAVGIAPSYDNIRRTGDKIIFNGLANILYDVEADSDTHGIGIFGRRYFSISDKFSIIAHLEAGASDRRIDNKVLREKDIMSESQSMLKTMYVRMRPGVAFFPSEKLGIESYLGIIEWTRNRSRIIQNGDYNGDEISNVVDVNMNAGAFNLSLIYFLRLKP